MVVASLAALTSGLVVPKASADQISDLRAQASALANRIQQLGQQEEALSEKYDAAQLAVQGLEARVTQAALQVAAADAHVSRTRNALRQDAVEAYVHGGSSPLTASSNVVANASNSLLRAEYVDSLATGQSDSIDQYRLAAVQDQAAKTNLQHETQAAQREVQQVDQDRRAVSSLQAQLEGTLHKDTGQIAILVAQQQAAEAAAAAAAARARLAAQQAAQQQAAEAAQAAAAAAARQAANTAGSLATSSATHLTSSGPPSTAAPAPVPVTPSPPPVGGGAGGAVAAAERALGTPYVWGAAGPPGPSGGFDCSGLVMWAYAQVGISLPHFSGAQYADTIHIPMSALAPGDLVFFADPNQHVAMYIGGGDIIEAPYTGAFVHIVPMYSGFVLASRVA
jgi:cell wall-associated NlpC family hydrolase